MIHALLPGSRCKSGEGPFAFHDIHRILTSGIVGNHHGLSLMPPIAKVVEAQDSGSFIDDETQ